MDYSALNAKVTYQLRATRNLKWPMPHMKNMMGSTYSALEKLEKSIFDRS
jgi:hypothetical protein